MPGQLGGMLHVPFVIESASDPRGCFRFGPAAIYYYNTHFRGAGRGGRTPYCKFVHDVQYVPSDSGASVCPAGALALSAAECASLPGWLGGSAPEPLSMNTAHEPPGCIRHAGGSYHYNVHPEGTGRKGSVLHCKISEDIAYLVGKPGGPCPEDAMALTEAECRGAAQDLGVLLRDPLRGTGTPGCSLKGGVLVFGEGGPETQRVCRRPPVLGFVAGADGGRSCSLGALALTEAECRHLPALFGGQPREPFSVRSTAEPPGCFSSEAGFGFNGFASGAGKSGSRPHCKLSRQLEYVVGSAGASLCPPGATPLSEAECQGVPKWFGGTLREPFVVGRSDWPRGCLRLGGNYAYNIDPVGSGDTGKTPLCKRELLQDVAYVVGSDGAGECPPGAVALSRTECRGITSWFQGNLGVPFVEESRDSPIGCFARAERYYFNIHGTGSASKGSTPYCKLTYTVDYVVGSNGDNDCQKDTLPLNEAECRGLPKRFGGFLSNEFNIRDVSQPKGCFRSSDRDGSAYSFNTVEAGSGRRGSTPYCRRGEDQYVV